MNALKGLSPSEVMRLNQTHKTVPFVYWNAFEQAFGSDCVRHFDL